MRCTRSSAVTSQTRCRSSLNTTRRPVPESGRWGHHRDPLAGAVAAGGLAGSAGGGGLLGYGVLAAARPEAFASVRTSELAPAASGLASRGSRPMPPSTATPVTTRAEASTAIRPYRGRSLEAVAAHFCLPALTFDRFTRLTATSR